MDAVRTGTRLAVTENPLGTLYKIFNVNYPLPIAVAGKTGTAEYCDDVANKANRCRFGAWPTHAWTLAYAPFDDPEIVILAFAYNGGEGGTVAAPIVARVMKAYFELKSIDIAKTQADKNIVIPSSTWRERIVSVYLLLIDKSEKDFML